MKDELIELIEKQLATKRDNIRWREYAVETAEDTKQIEVANALLSLLKCF